jgi:serine/threonine protein phosphatase PrpC
MSTVTCPTCGKENRRGANFCRYCQADLSPTRGMPGKSKQPQPARPQASSLATPPQTTPLMSSQAAGVLTPLQLRSVLSHPGDPRRRYGIVAARQLEHSIYYDAIDLTCPTCQIVHQQLPPYGVCLHCQSSLNVVLIHERLLPPGGSHSEKESKELLRLSTGHAGILPHKDIIQYQEHVYTVTEHPGRWGVLVRGRRQRLPDEALAGAAQAGQALAYLHENGFAQSEIVGATLESLIVVGGGKDVKLADLSTCIPLPSGDVQAIRTQINRDIAFLGKLLFYLATNKELARTSIEFAPPALRPFVERAMQEQYASVRDMLTDFSLLPSDATSTRPLKPSHGQATHPGRRHAGNEDAVVTFTFDKEEKGRAVPIGFYLVADGMGGHDAGDIASHTVERIVTDWIIKTKVLPDLRKATRKLTAESVPRDLLTQAIQQANEAILRRGKAKNSDLGSTVTAALVIGDVATIASVGDSRAYLLRDGRLEQITQDHSLVARLVDAGAIGPEEVGTHPQRNQIYRCLGHKPTVEVDVFIRQLQGGDMLVLCSDGLWEMVPDGAIQRIIEDARSPQKACDVLVEAANRAGGEDNIAVVVVEME